MSQASLCLERVHLVPSAHDAPVVCHVYVADGRIAEIDPELKPVQPVDEVLDCSQHVAIPGLANLHLHCRPGRALNDGMPVPVWHKAVDKIAQAMQPEDSYTGALLAYGEMLLGGVTSSLVMTRFFDHAARAAEDLGIRSAVVPLAGDGRGAHGHALDELEPALQTIRDDRRAADARVQLWPGFDSPLSTSFDGMKAVARLAEERRLGLHAHMAETEFEVSKFRQTNDRSEGAAFLDAGLMRERAVLAHCNWLDERDVERFLQTGAAVVHNPTSNMKFASGVCEVRALRKAGVKVALGTDGMLSNFRLDMFDAMRGAANLQRIHTGDATALTAADVLEMATVNGASILQPQTGEIAEGWVADLAVIDMRGLHLQPYRRDPLNDPDLLNLIVWCARASDVQHVVCDGRVVVRDRALTLGSADEIAERVRATDARMRPLLSA